MHRNQLAFYSITSSALASNGTVRIERLAALIGDDYARRTLRAGRPIYLVRRPNDSA
jgi:hypothetical protein